MSYSSRSCLKYNATDKSADYTDFSYLVVRENLAGNQVKQSKTVKQYNGDPAYLHHFLRDSHKQFKAVATENAWTQVVQFSNFYEDVLKGPAKDYWDEALEEGNGPDDPIDPEDPGADDFEMTVVNFIGKIADQEYPGYYVWEYLRELKYDDILSRFQHKPSAFLRHIKKIEGMCEHLAMRDNTQPSDETVNLWYYQSFKEEHRDWLKDLDNFGNNDPLTMTREQMASRWDAHLSKQVSDAKKAAKNGHNNRDRDGPGNNGYQKNRNGYKGGRGDRKRGDRKRKGGNGNGHDNDSSPSQKKPFVNYAEQKCEFHGGHKWKDCNANPYKGNKNFKEGNCLKVLGRDDIDKFPWFVASVKKQRPETFAKHDGTSQRQPQQQQFQFAPPVGMPPVAMPPMVPQQPAQRAPPNYAYMMQPPIQQQAMGGQVAGVPQQNSYLMQPAPVMSEQQPAPNAVQSGGSRWVLVNGQYRML